MHQLHSIWVAVAITANALSCGSSLFQRANDSSNRTSLISTRRLCSSARPLSSTWPYLRLE